MENLIRPDFTALVAPAVPEAAAPPKAMLTVDASGSQTVVRINSSSLSLLQTCPRKARYTLHDGWRSRTGSPPLIFGSAIHKALEVFYAHPKSERTLPDDFEDRAALMAHGHEAPEAHFLYDAIRAFVAAAAPLQALPDTDSRSLASGVWMLGHYFRTYLMDAYVIHRDASGPFVERTCEAVLWESPALRIILFGTIDFIMRNEATGDLLPGDHKTASRMGTEFLNRVKPNHQYSGYLWLCQNALGLPGDQFMVNGLQVKPKPLTARGGPPTFTRQITRRTAADLVEFVDAVRWAVSSFLSWRRDDNWPLGSVDACANWGGCGFLDVCSAPNELRQNILESKFQHGET